MPQWVIGMIEGTVDEDEASELATGGSFSSGINGNWPEICRDGKGSFERLGPRHTTCGLGNASGGLATIVTIRNLILPRQVMLVERHCV